MQPVSHVIQKLNGQKWNVLLRQSPFIPQTSQTPLPWFS